MALEASGRVEERQLPKNKRRGQRKGFLFPTGNPAYCAGDGGAIAAQWRNSEDGQPAYRRSQNTTAETYGAMEAFKNLEVSTARPVLEASGICRFAKPPKYAVRWVSDLLERFGLRLVEGMRTRANGRTRVYSISNETKRGLPGWREMLAIVDRRATVPDGPVKTYRSASGTRTETTP